MEEFVVWVNESNEKQGLISKTEAHEKGILHRAISVLIYNSKGEMLIQQRAAEKYHWPLKWSNACCTHPRDHESFLESAERRTEEELGIKTSLTELYRFIYKAQDEETKLIEHEFDVVFKSIYDGEIPFNKKEVADIKWIPISDLYEDVEKNPENYTFWFKEILKELKVVEE